LCRNRNGL
jgi:hypothetical protein